MHVSVVEWSCESAKKLSTFLSIFSSKFHPLLNCIVILIMQSFVQDDGGRFSFSGWQAAHASGQENEAKKVEIPQIGHNTICDLLRPMNRRGECFVKLKQRKDDRDQNSANKKSNECGKAEVYERNCRAKLIVEGSKRGKKFGFKIVTARSFFGIFVNFCFKRFTVKIINISCGLVGG